MKYIPVALVLLFGVCTSVRGELTEMEAKYLRLGVDEPNLGNANPFAPEHICENIFRQRILASKDEILQRAFILRQLPHQLSSILENLDRNRKMVGQAQYRQMTAGERSELIAKFEEQMGLLESLIERLSNGEERERCKHIPPEYRSRFNKIQQKYAAAPTSNKR